MLIIRLTSLFAWYHKSRHTPKKRNPATATTVAAADVGADQEQCEQESGVCTKVVAPPQPRTISKPKTIHREADILIEDLQATKAADGTTRTQMMQQSCRLYMRMIFSLVYIIWSRQQDSVPALTPNRTREEVDVPTVKFCCDVFTPKSANLIACMHLLLLITGSGPMVR